MNMKGRVNSSELGFCENAGHSGDVIITWENDKVVELECGFGNRKTCKFADSCELLNRHPIGSVQKPGDSQN